MRRIIDPSTVPVRTRPRDERDLLITASNSFLLAYDNLSRIPDWFSDAFCRVASGGGFSTRELYSDTEEQLFHVCRPIVLNGIDHLPERANLADRALILRLPRIPEASRKTEKQIFADFEADLPQILGGLLYVIAGTLKQLPSTRIERLPRLADLASWAVAAETPLGFSEGTFLSAFVESRNETVESTLEGDSVAGAIRILLESQQTRAGTCSELMLALENLEAIPPRAQDWPKSARALSGRLRRLGTFMREVGLEITFEGKTTNGKRLVTRAAISTRDHSAGLCRTCWTAKQHQA